MALEPGHAAPDLILPSADGNRPTPLAEQWKDGPVVLLFFPLAFTDTCTAEMCAVRDDMGAYTALDARVVAVSVDSPWVLDRYRREIGADYLFLSDFNREAIQAYDVVRKTPVGPGLMGVSERAAFVIGRDGRIRYSWSSTTPGLLPPFDEIKHALNGGA
ncbi:MAG TPA: redoxin domain-containing protein [Longimicrobium sp.]